jgi:hypothetical protein
VVDSTSTSRRVRAMMSMAVKDIRRPGIRPQPLSCPGNVRASETLDGR